MSLINVIITFINNVSTVEQKLHLWTHALPYFFLVQGITVYLFLVTTLPLNNEMKITYIVISKDILPFLQDRNGIESGVTSSQSICGSIFISSVF